MVLFVAYGYAFYYKNVFSIIIYHHMHRETLRSTAMTAEANSYE